MALSVESVNAHLLGWYEDDYNFLCIYYISIHQYIQCLVFHNMHVHSIVSHHMHLIGECVLFMHFYFPRYRLKVKVSRDYLPQKM